MNFRFHILDRNNVSTEIEEPVGFDGLTCEIGRDADWHGIFFTNSGENFEYYNTAYHLLKNEYELYGAQGDMTLIMEQECAGVWTEFERGKFVFSKYDCEEDDCYIKCPLESVSEVMDLRNRVDQKVNLESLKAFDETTDLAAYDKLPFAIQLPSKGIFMQNKGEMQVAETTEFTLSGLPFDYTHVSIRHEWFQIVPQIENIEINEFGSFTTAATPEHQVIKAGWYDPRADDRFESVINGSDATPPDTRRIFFNGDIATTLLSNDGNLNNFDSVKNFSLNVSYSFDIITSYAAIASLYKIVVIRRKNGSFEYLTKERIISGTTMSGADGGENGYDPATIWRVNSTHTVSFTANYSDISLRDGDELFVAVCGLAVYSAFYGGDGVGITSGWDGPYNAYDIVSKSGSVVMQTLTHFAETTSKVFAVNEAISRISESITNDKLRAYSEYFGRTDSHPYAHAADGCGSLEVITDGLRIRRQENKTPGQTDVFSQSLQDIFKGLCPIHNIGIGIETDTNRAGYNRLRVEPWNFFYNDTLVMSCTGINGLSRKTNEKEIYSVFQFGYDKWEAEEYNGLDELLTKRNYRTLLSQIKNTLTQVSSFISSGYALEVTRRKGNDNTKDWRYDKDVFIIRAKRGATANFLIQFFAGNTMNVAVFNSDYSIAEQFFVVGATISIAGTLNTGSFTVTAVSRITGNLAVTVSQTTVDELNSVLVTNNQQMSAELGNVTNPVNIVDPDTLYNFRISPIRNAMRWANKILASYRQFNVDSKIIFTDGDGNYFAQGEMTDTNCGQEASALTENQTIDISSFADSADAKPVLFPERVTFTYPFTAQDYVNIKANPGGKIYFEGANDSGYGWIDTIIWNPDDGTAQFSLIPKFTN